MTEHVTELGLPIGEPVPHWSPRPRPSRATIEGRFCRLEPLDADRHATALHEAYAADRERRIWTYLPYGPFESAAEYRGFVEAVQGKDDPVFYAIVDLETGRPLGVASYLRIDPAMGTIEVGSICFSPSLQRSPLATEAMYLMMRHVFDDLGYRRYEWKCNSRNAASIAAARRLGFQFEGVFRQMMVAKGRNRDTAWLSILDREWPAAKAAFEAWLDPANFDASGAQRRRLEDLRLGRSESADVLAASCLCGGVRIEVSGQVGPVVYCHCSRCQKASGTAFAANADVRAPYWKIVAGSDLIREFASSPGVWRAFCSTCGSPLYSRRDANPDMHRIRLGIVDGDPRRRPIAHFWVESQAPWYTIADGLPAFARGPADHEEEIAALRGKG